MENCEKKVIREIFEYIKHRLKFLIIYVSIYFNQDSRWIKNIRIRVYSLFQMGLMFFIRVIFHASLSLLWLRYVGKVFVFV